VIFTLIGCFATYEVIKRIHYLRPLFGLKDAEKQIKQHAKNSYQ